MFDELKYNHTAKIALGLVFAVAMTLLWLQGRLWWCQAGDMVPWSWDIWSTHNSQHIVDPYAFTHVLHGVLEFWLIGLIFRKMPIVWRLVLAVTIEGTWEVAENSAFMIERYRSETISLDYFGDSIINSMSDIMCCALGFTLAYKLKFWRSLMLFLATEAVLIVWIRDSLILNIIMLVHKSDVIKTWQMAGH